MGGSPVRIFKSATRTVAYSSAGALLGVVANSTGLALVPTGLPPFKDVVASGDWVEQVLSDKPLPSDLEVFPLVLDEEGNLWQADTATGRWWHEGLSHENLDRMEVCEGALTFVAVQ